MDWILSTLTVIGNFLIGRKIKWGWIMFIGIGMLWLYYALYILNPPQYGLVPATIINIVIGISSTVKWFKEDKKK